MTFMMTMDQWPFSAQYFPLMDMPSRTPSFQPLFYSLLLLMCDNFKNSQLNHHILKIKGYIVFKKTIAIISVGTLLISCGGDGSSSNDAAQGVSASISISGAVQKGPFIVGTPVFINKLDSFGNASESTVITEISDSVGTFSFDVSASGPVQMVANGYYFNEVTGQVSHGTLTLKAIYDASSENIQVAYVNILTHLINDRILKLIKTGNMEVKDAISEAQLELLNAMKPVFPIESSPNFSALSVYNTTPENSIGNAYLLAVSTAFYKYSELKAEGENTSADAQLALSLNLIAKDFADDGLIQQPNFLVDLTTALRKLDPIAISNNLKTRSSIDYSEALNTPDVTQFFGLCAGSAECMWSARAPMPIAIRDQASAVHTGKVYFFGGTTINDKDCDLMPWCNAYNLVFEYDPETNQWVRKNNMPFGLQTLTAHTVGDKIYLFGGSDKYGLNNSVLEYNPIQDSWNQKSAIPTPRMNFASAEIAGRIYIIGGASDQKKNTVEIYNADKNEWSIGEDAPVEESNAPACAVDDKIYYFTESPKGTYVYNTGNGTWTANSHSPTPTAGYGRSCVTIGSDVFVVGGVDGNISIGGAFDNQQLLGQFISYSTSNDTWKEVTYLPTPRYRFSANLIGSNIFVFGGIKDIGGATPTNEVEVVNTTLTR